MSGATIPPWPRRPQRLATAVVEELVDQIVSGSWPAGSLLPPEPTLCESFGVSRAVVREAVKALEALRLVRVRQGHGTTVEPIDDAVLLDPVVLAALVRHDERLAILDDLVDVRRALEAQMAGQAALRMDARQRAAVTEAMHDLHDSVEDPAAYLACDVAFHDAVHRASGNRLARATVHLLVEQAYRSLRYVGEPTPEECRFSNTEHRAVWSAVVEGRASDAARLMDAHVRDAWRRRRPSRDDVPR